MSDLKSIDKVKLEKLFGMSTGYIMDFSNRTFQEFILENAGIDIYDNKYDYSSCSKANRLRAFWKRESNYTVGKLLEALLEYWKSHKLISDSKINSSEEKLFNECYQISKTLMQEGYSTDDISIDVYFEEIQEKIIKQIKLAKFTIWLAVAWFTDKVLFDHLVAKKNQGVNVQLIINDDDINKNSGLNYEEEFETYKIKKTDQYQNIMHNKFCIIDLKTVIHGSYNWTKKAQYNNETISIDKSREIAEQFAEKFNNLKES